MRKMRKNGKGRILSAALAVSLAASQAGVCLQAEGDATVISITSEDDFLLLADRCMDETFSEGKRFRLDADLDLSGYEDFCIPVMNGTFDGNGHEITGVVLDGDMSDYGLFRYVGDEGLIFGLTVEAEALGGEEQENMGIIAGSNAGTIRDCASRGSLNGYQQTGGIAGVNLESGVILRCTNEASADGRTNTGGIVGDNRGTVSDCVNTGGVNTSQKVKKEMDGDGSMTVSIPGAAAGLAKDERSSQTGGIAGISSGKLAYCANKGTVGCAHLGEEVGGVAGRQSGELIYCRNEGMVSGRKSVGGIVGYFDPYEAACYDREYRQELEDELDALSDAVDALSDAARETGDHLWDNVDVLSDQLKALRSSVRGYLDEYGELAEDGREEMEDRVSSLENTIDGMQFLTGAEDLAGRAAQIREDIRQMQALIEQLKPYAAQQGDALQGVLDQYQEQIGQLQGKLEDLEGYLQNAGSAGDSTEEDGDEPAGENESEEDGGEPAEEDRTEEDGDEPAGENRTEEDVIEPTGEDSTENSVGEDAVTDEVQDTVQNQGEPAEPGTDAPAEESPAASEEEAPAAPAEESPAASGEEVSAAPAETSPAQDADDPAPASDGTGMTPMAFVCTTEGVADAAAAESSQAAELLRKLQELSADIQAQMQGIMGTLEQLPGQAERLSQDFKTMEDQIRAIDRSLGNTLDDFGDTMDRMKTDLQGQGDRISDQMESSGDTLESDMDGVSDRLDDVEKHFENIRGILSDGLDDLTRSIQERTVYVDVSELMDGTEEEGKVASCDNSGEILADSRGGGIVGSISKDSAERTADWPFDLLEAKDDEEDDDDDTKLTRHVQALVADCVNTAAVSAEQGYAGGIAGKADYGVIVSCESYEDVQAADGSYAGGIAGQSKNAIRDCYYLGGVSAEAYLGGAAGKGEDVSGCYICAYLEPSEEKAAYSGAVAGSAEGAVENNWFVENGYGAVNGVTRKAEASGVSYEELLVQKPLPENFQSFTVRFVDEGETVWEGTFTYGDSLPGEEYPALTAPEGEYAFWEEKDLSSIRRNLTVHSVYRAFLPSLSSDAQEGEAQILLGGSFYPDSSLKVEEASEEESASLEQMLEEQGLAGRYRLRAAYRYEISQVEALDQGISLRVKRSRRGNSLAAVSGSMEWTDEIRDAQKTGSFLAADLKLEKNGYVLVLEKTSAWETAAAAAAVMCAAAGIIACCVKRKHGRSGREAAAEQR